MRRLLCVAAPLSNTRGVRCFVPENECLVAMRPKSAVESGSFASQESAAPRLMPNLGSLTPKMTCDVVAAFAKAMWWFCSGPHRGGWTTCSDFGKVGLSRSGYYFLGLRGGCLLVHPVLTYFVFFTVYVFPIHRCKEKVELPYQSLWNFSVRNGSCVGHSWSHQCA